MAPSHIHTPHDGRGNRDVFLNGKKIDHVIFADERRGIVRAFRYPLRLDKYKKRVLSQTFRGSVVVVKVNR